MTINDSPFMPYGEPMSLHKPTMHHRPHTHDMDHWLLYDDDSMSAPFSLLGNHDRDIRAPSSPQLPHLSLPEVNKEIDMSFSSEDSSSSQSPSQPLLGLPGADTDDDLLPVEYAVASSSPPLVSKADNLPLELPSESLLLISDLQDVPCVRCNRSVFFSLI